MTALTLKGWCLVHKWTSLVCTAFLLMLCLTGLPLIFFHEIEHALGYTVEPPPLPDTDKRASLDAIVAEAKARTPGEAVQFVFEDPDEPDVWFVRFGETVDAPEASTLLIFDARTGAILHTYPLGQGIMNIMFQLHVDLFAGLPGTLFLGFMGLLFVISLVSGVVVYGPFMRKLPFGTVRVDRARRTHWLDLHNLLGIVTVTWALVVGGTGVINTLAIPIFSQWQSTELAAMLGPAQGAPPLREGGSAQQALAAAKAAAPGKALSFLAFPGNGFAGPHHFTAFMRGTTPLTSKLLTPVVIDARTGEMTATRVLPWYVSALLLSQPLHFGDYGGLPLKILWALLDLITIVVLASGLYLWLAKRPVPLEQRLREEAELEEAVAFTRSTQARSLVPR